MPRGLTTYGSSQTSFRVSSTHDGTVFRGGSSVGIRLHHRSQVAGCICISANSQFMFLSGHFTVRSFRSRRSSYSAVIVSASSWPKRPTRWEPGINSISSACMRSTALHFPHSMQTDFVTFVLVVVGLDSQALHRSPGGIESSSQWIQQSFFTNRSMLMIKSPARESRL